MKIIRMIFSKRDPSPNATFSQSSLQFFFLTSSRKVDTYRKVTPNIVRQNFSFYSITYKISERYICWVLHSMIEISVSNCLFSRRTMRDILSDISPITFAYLRHFGDQ